MLSVINFIYLFGLGHLTTQPYRVML